MVRIRLRRVGAKKQPSYRIVVADKRSPRDGRFIENIGFYNPRTEPETVRYDEERALYWLSVGAQPSDAVHRMFKSWGTFDRLQRMRQGEELETLVEEALAEAEQRAPISPKTRHEPTGVSKKKAEAAMQAAVETEEVAEAEEPAEEVVTEEEATTVVEEDAVDSVEEEEDSAEEAVTEEEATTVAEEDAVDSVEEAEESEAEEDAEDTAKDEEETNEIAEEETDPETE